MADFARGITWAVLAMALCSHSADLPRARRSIASAGTALAHCLRAYSAANASASA